MDQDQVSIHKEVELILAFFLYKYGPRYLGQIELMVENKIVLYYDILKFS